MQVGSVVKSLKMSNSPFKPSGPVRSVDPANAKVIRRIEDQFDNS